MPIKAENRALYPPNWHEISRQVRERADHRCEECGLRNYSVGYRYGNGHFRRIAGNGPCDCAGDGLSWPSLERLTYREAAQVACVANSEGKCDAEGNRWIVIILTVAHLDHDPRNCDLSNLKALCQQCHLRYDQRHHAETSSATRRAGKAIELPFENAVQPESP